MASFQGGTNSGYLSAAPYRLNTQLFEDEYEFMTGLPSIFTIQNNYLYCIVIPQTKTN
jgi:hypothetical protein